MTIPLRPLSHHFVAYLYCVKYNLKALIPDISDKQLSALLHRLIYVAAVLLFKFLLDQYYDLFSDYFGYYGMLKEPRSPYIFILTYLIITVFACIIPLHAKKPSNLFAQLLFMMQYIPVSSFFVYYDKASVGGFAGITLVYAGMILFTRLDLGKGFSKLPHLGRNYFYLSIMAISILFVLLAMQKYGFSIKSVDFSDLYSLRAEFKEETNRLYGYIFSWTSHVLVTLLLVLAMRRGNPFLFLFSLILGYYFFTLGGHKAVLFTLPYLIILYLLLRYFKNHFGLAIALGFVAMVGLLYLYDRHIDYFTMASSIAVRRNFLMPAQLYFNYVEFFSSHPIDRFAQNFPFNIFNSSQYSMPLPRIVAEAYLPKGHETYANTGVVADTFANLGYYAYPVVMLFFFLFFWASDQLAKHRDTLVVTATLSVFVLNFINGGLIVNVITHGLLITLLLLLFYPKNVYTPAKTAAAA